MIHLYGKLYKMNLIIQEEILLKKEFINIILDKYTNIKELKFQVSIQIIKR